MNNYKKLDVFFEKRKVGTLARTTDYLVAFEYDSEWINSGFSLNPFSLPLRKEVFIPKGYDPFDGLFGVFSDSLPDGWGRLLLDRFLLSHSVNPESVDSLNRLAIVGSSGMGALSYVPEIEFEIDISNKTIDELATECGKIYDSKKSEDLDVLFRLGGSSGGARPKIFYEFDGEEWIVKFPASFDPKDIGEQEYDYAECAKRCGIIFPKTRLIPSKNCSGYFAVKRFDRENGRRIYMASVSALLETSHRLPNLDYNILMQLAMKLTNSYKEIEKMFRIMCFNVFAHNRDDHSKNFSFIYNTEDNKWCVSPAYDLTYSHSIGGEHATTVNGNGRNPDMKDVLAVAENIKMNLSKAKIIANEIKEIVYTDLENKYLKN